MKKTIARTYPTLKSWRAATGMNQREAARFLDISQNYYSRVERGISAPRGPILRRITERAKVPLEVLVGAA